jgi:hypothetical protein
MTADRDALIRALVKLAAKDTREVFEGHKRAKEAADYMEQLLLASPKIGAVAELVRAGFALEKALAGDSLGDLDGARDDFAAALDALGDRGVG